MQSVLRLVYPPQCVSCGNLVEEDFGLCGACWRDTPFVTGTVCDRCGTPLPGESFGATVLCDECLTIDRPWRRGRAALIYRDNARRLVLAFKHGDRIDLARPAARWMAGIAEPLIAGDTVVVPVPVHYLRRVKRRYNQAAVLAREVARLACRPMIPDLLCRVRQTRMQDGMSADERFANLDGAIAPASAAADRLRGRRVLLVDDVMTSGATLGAAAQASRAAGAARVDILVLARVAKDA